MSLVNTNISWISTNPDGQDDTFHCQPKETSHVICGHYGVLSFTSPTYEVHEESSFLRMTVVRSGGGIGTVHVSYRIQHLTTNDADVTPTAFYTSQQQIVFHPGEIEKSFLITIHDDRILVSLL